MARVARAQRGDPRGTPGGGEQRYLRLDPTRSDGFLRAAQALLDAGASANTGFWEIDHEPEPEWESAIYGAAGVAHHPELTRLLLDHGANPNDEETPTESVSALLEAGASVRGVMFPSGYAAVDELLKAHGAES